MAKAMRNRSVCTSSSRRRTFHLLLVVVLLFNSCCLIIVFAPLVTCIHHNSRRHGFKTHFGVIRGGDNYGRKIINNDDNTEYDSDDHDDDDDDDEERTRFWSLSALFRLNANAKDDASLPPSHYLQRGGNRRGGALAVRTSQSKTFVDVTPVSTASSRLLLRNDQDNDDDDDEYEEEEEEQSDRLLDYDESNEALQQVVKEYIDEEDSEKAPQADEVEEIDTLAEEEEGYDDDDDDEEEDEILSRTSLSQSTNDSIEEDDRNDVSAENNIVEPEFNAEEMVGTDSRREVPLTPSSFDKVDVALDVESELKETSRGNPSHAKGILKDASKLWWTNAWTELASDDVPDLVDVASDTSSDADVSVSVEAEFPHESQTDEQASDYVKVDVEVMDIPTVQLDEERDKELAAASDEPASQLPFRQNEDVQLVEETETDDRAIVSESPQLSSQTPSEADRSRVLVKEIAAVEEQKDSPYISSGYWTTIDRIASLGLSNVSDALKLSRHLRAARKATARVTGLHGFISQKGKRSTALPENALVSSTDVETLNDEDLGRIRRRIAAIEIAKQNVAKRAAERAEAAEKKRRGLFRRRRRANQVDDLETTSRTVTAELDEAEISSLYLNLEQKSLEEQLEEKRRKERVQEIDRLISKRQKDLLDLQCEKDDLQRRPNPLYKYDTAADGKTSREFNFPPQELVDEYIDELIATGRLEKMNHTDLWKNGAEFDDEEDESIGDDLFVPSADARKLYERRKEKPSPRGTDSKSSNGNGGGGSWLLRQNLGKGGSLGEKIGEAVETAGYKAVCANVMSALARSIAAIHGMNIMTHSDIRLYMEQSPDLPPVGKNVIPGSTDAHNYAQEAIMDAMRKGVSKRKKRSSRSRRMQVEEAFLQRDAVVETLLSHCQISAPLLKLFPLSWQRALLGNIISLIAAVVSDFCDGIQLQILGHQLSFAFKPITESDMIRHIGMGGNAFNNRRARPEQFEAAIAATAEDVSESLQFLDRWHHRALGSGMLRAQIANLIARIVLTLTDEVLSGAQMNLWSAQAGGPRMVAGLEYRVSPEEFD